MRSSRVIRLGLGVLGCALLSVWVTSPASSQYTPEQFLADCQVGLAKLEERYRHCSGRYQIIQNRPLFDWQLIRDVEFAVSGEQWLIICHNLEEWRKGHLYKVHYQQSVRGANSVYSFLLTGRYETRELRLETYEMAEEVASKPSGGEIRNELAYWLSPIHAPYCMGAFPLLPLLRHPTFRVLKLREGEREGVRVIRADFEVRPGQPFTDPRISWTREPVWGWFEVAPDQEWTVRAFEYTYMAPGHKPEIPLVKARVNGEVSYSTDSNGRPMVTYFKRSTSWRDLPPDSMIEMKDIQIEYGPVSEDRFRLSYYGLPEPPSVTWVQERRTPVYVWLFVAAGVLLTLGIFFRWLSRRLRRGHSEG
jgi:hypothetical protein